MPVAVSRNVSSCVWDSFPMLYRLLLRSEDHALPTQLRPLIAEWSRLLFVIWNFRSDISHAQINITTRDWPVREMHQSTLGELRTLYDGLRSNAVDANVDAAEVRQLIVDLVECEISVEANRDDLREGGHVYGRPLQRFLMRRKLFAADIKSDTNGRYAALNEPRPRRAGAAAPAVPGEFVGQEGVLGLCHKTVPTSGGFSGHLFVTVCLCKHVKIFAFTLLDGGESPRYVLELLEALLARPLVFVYDNACHARHYVMSRVPHKFFQMLLICDRFHSPNHKACSKCFATYEWDHVPYIKKANTSAMEQTNAELVKHLASFISFQCPAFAMDTLELYMLAMNSKKHRDAV